MKTPAQVLWLALPQSPGVLWFADPRGSGAACGASDLAVPPVTGGGALFPSWLDHWVAHHVGDIEGETSEDEDTEDVTDKSNESARVVVPFNMIMEQREPNSMGFRLRVPLAHLPKESAS